MGFWEGFSNFVSGKPVFDETVQDDTAQAKNETPKADESHKSNLVDEHGKKIAPDISFKKLKSHVNGPKVTTWAWVVNNSPFEVEIEKLEFHGYHNHIKRRLKPSEGHDVKVYDGAVITHDHDHFVRLYFTIHENDDLFQEDYEIEYNRESDGTYTLEEFRKSSPPRDI